MCDMVYSGRPQQAICTLKALLQQSSGRKPLSTSALSFVKLIKASATLEKHVTFVMDNNKVVKIDQDARMMVEHMSEMEATSKSNPVCNKHSCPILKKPGLAFVSAGSPHKFATSSTLTRTSSSAFSRKSAAKSTAVSRPLKRKTASKEQSCAVGSTVPAPCPKKKTISRPAKVISKALVAPGVKAQSVATAQLAKPPHNQKDIKASAKMEPLKKSLENTDVALNLHEVNLPSASHLKSAIPELKKPRKEPSHVSACKTTLTGNTFKVGLNQLMIVSWEGRQQVYCLLCSVRLKSSSHPSSYNHCLNYVKMKYLGWIAAPSALECKLSNIVARLAEVERDVGLQIPQRVEVTKEVYKKLAALEEYKAVEMVKAVLMQKDPRVSSFKAQTAEALRWEAASPCQVSSSVDGGVSVVDDNSECYNQTQQEHKLEETLQIQSTGKDNVVELWSVKGQSSNEDQSDVVQDQLQASVCDKVQPHLVPGLAEELKETVQQHKFEPDAEVLYMSETAHGNESPDNLKTSSDAEHSHPPVRQHWLSDSASQVAQKGLESPPEPVQIYSPQLQTPASAATEQQNPSGSSLGTEQGTGFGQPSSSPAQSRTLFGAKLKGCSHLSIFLKVDQSVKAVIGMAFVWECRGLSQKTFYLCESCRETLTLRDICGHVVSLSHQLRHLWKNHPEFLQMFWLKEELPPELKLDILSDVVCELAARETFHKVDAQCVLLGEELYWLVRTAHFSEALKVVKNINKEKQIAFYRPVSSAQQNGQQGDCPSAENSHLAEDLLAPVLKTNPTSDFDDKRSHNFSLSEILI